MSREYEIIRHDRFKHLNIFMLRMYSRAPHLHTELEVGFVLEGTLEVKLESHTDVLSPGDIFLINPLEVHEFSAGDGGATLLAIQTSYKIMNNFLSAPIIPRFSRSGALSRLIGDRPEDYFVLWSAAVRLSLEYFRAQCDPFLSFSLLVELLMALISKVPFSLQREEDYRPMKARADRMLSILEYIDDNFSRKLLLNEIAEREGLTLVYLSHFFKDMMGLSFQDYLKRKRFEEARRLLLTTDRKLLDVSIACGFSDVRYMTEVFIKNTGLSPREYRQTNSGSGTVADCQPAGTEERLSEVKSVLLLSDCLEVLESSAHENSGVQGG